MALTKNPSLENWLTRMLLLGSVPFYLVSILALVKAGTSLWLIGFFAMLGFVWIGYLSTSVYHRTRYTLHGISGALMGLEQKDYSIKLPERNTSGALLEVHMLVNTLLEQMRNQRISQAERQALLATLVEHNPMAILAFDQQAELRFTNNKAETYFGVREADIKKNLGLGFDHIMSANHDGQSIIDLQHNGIDKRFVLEIHTYREDGEQHRLVFLSEVSSLLRNEERKAWRNLVRVISHEINNSLTPIATLAQMLRDSGSTLDTDSENPMSQGLDLIIERALTLGRFVKSYQHFINNPEPRPRPVSILSMMDKIVGLYPEEDIQILSRYDIDFFVDIDLMEQVLINLVKNGLEACQSIGKPPRLDIRWQQKGEVVLISVIDQGGGIQDKDNLFVPFYTTKSGGTGIGLVFCRQVVEAHGGVLTLTNNTLANNTESTGAVATMKLPLKPVSATSDASTSLKV